MPDTSANRDLLMGKVAQVLNERELVINIGRNQGVVRGMKFAVLADSPIEIHDPDTNGLIGVIDRPKVRVQATTVDENISICSTYETRVVGNMPSAADLLASQLIPRHTVYVDLRSDNKDRPKPLSPEESYVKIGDPVREIPEPAATPAKTE